MVPKQLRDAVWRTYRPGQCDDMRPSREWHDAADAAIESVFQQEAEAERAKSQLGLPGLR